MNGAIIYQGPSLLDGKPIVVIATGLQKSSANAKTGDMIQTYILRGDISPTEAVRTNADVSICGQCPHRGTGNGKNRSCYVTVYQGPQAVWNAGMRGNYPVITDYSIFANRMVRIGSYGDPAAVPLSVWERVIEHATGYTAYTHQWLNNPEYKKICVASVDSVSEATLAQSLGWRTFRVARVGMPNKSLREIVCPASKEAGYKLQCFQCKSCDGTGNNRRGSIVIQAHGGRGVKVSIEKLLLTVE